jgi:hypothetical protein
VHILGTAVLGRHRGQESEAVKWGALKAADPVVTPSAFESFSLVVEAWLAGRPVAVNARCSATVEACRRSGGGLRFAARSAGAAELFGARCGRGLKLAHRPSKTCS